MTSDPAPPPAGVSLGPAVGTGGVAHWVIALHGAILVVAVIVTGLSHLGNPWQCDAHVQRVLRDPDVNPNAAGPGRGGTTLPDRLASICRRVPRGLFAPVAPLTYAVEWEFSRGDPVSFRRTDLLLHAANALLLWWVLTLLLRRGSSAAVAATLLTWGLALLWALHPALVGTWAGDLERAGLLSGGFALLALGLHVRALELRRSLYFAVSTAALLLAMLSKPIVGWILLAIVLELTTHGWRRALVTPRLYIITALCVAFAKLSTWGSVEGDAAGLGAAAFSRGAVAIWAYFRMGCLPIDQPFAVLPDPGVTWNDPRVWGGLLLLLASAVHTTLAWRRPPLRPVLLGWAWVWATLLPAVGLSAWHGSAPADRDLYLPLMGGALVLGAVLLSWLASLTPRGLLRALPVTHLIVVGMAGLFVFLDIPRCATARSSVRRARHLADTHPNDPRALEALAATYEAAQSHPLPADELARIPQGQSQAAHFRALTRETLAALADSEHLAAQFSDDRARAALHGRLAEAFLRAGAAAQGLAQAELARQLAPDTFDTWRHLAHAYQALDQYTDAEDAYRRCEARLPDDPVLRSAHFNDYGALLLFTLERDSEACAKFTRAFEAGDPPPLAKMGMALCQIRYGEGAVGYQLISEVLHADPTNAQAGLILAEYHLRSHHWDQATKVYDALIRDDPTNYTALRGYHEVCLQSGRPQDAVPAWSDALERAPDRREFRSYFVWALALAGDAMTAEAARDLLSADPQNPLACLASMLVSLRDGDMTTAVEWVKRSAAGEPVPKAREFDRALAALRLLYSRRQLPNELPLVEAALLLYGGYGAAARADARLRLDEFLAAFPESRWSGLARELRTELSDVPTRP